jgi:Zn-dependent M28 family amino/carboxypeptidase
MHIGKRVALGGAILAFLSMPATAMGAKKKAKITVKSVAAVPFSVAQGGAFELAGKVKSAKRRKASAGRLRVELRTLANKRAPRLGTFAIKRLKPNRTRSFDERVVVASTVREGTYLVRACAKRKRGGAYKCKLAKGRITVTEAPAPADTRAASERLREAITQAGLTSHLEDLQRIGDTFGGNRASGLPGYQHSVQYVIDVLKDAGYNPRTQLFPFVLYTQNAPSTFARTDAGNERTYVENEDFGTFDYSGSGNVQDAGITPVDLDLGVGNTSTSGCEPEDFTGFPDGDVALVQRGDCDFGVKAANAEEAGAAGVVIFNQGNTAAADRNDAFVGTLGNPVGIPVVSLSYADGVELDTDAATATVDITTDTTNEARTSTNVLADTPGGDPNNVIVVGSHLDSVEAGPGINDNGTGSSFNLEAAVQMAKLRITPAKKVRFAFWGAEEAGLIGSTYYVEHLPEADLAKIKGNLNFDMLGSPNIAKFVYDGDFSDTDSGGLDVNPGAAEIERLFVDYFNSVGVPTEPTAFDGRSDYEAFQLSGIPAGGLFSGAEGIKSAAQAAKWGGTAGQPFDPCYHEACDTLANVDYAGFEQLADGGAHVLATLATRLQNPGGGAAERQTRSIGRKHSQYLGAHLRR